MAGTAGVSSKTGRHGAVRRFLERILPGFAPSFLGLVAVRIWLQCSIYDRYAFTDSGVVTIAANLARVFMIVLLMAYIARRGLPLRVRKVLAAVSGTAMSAASALFLAQVELGMDALLMPACLLAGLGIVWGGGMWIEFYMRLKPAQAFLNAFVSLALSCVAGFVLGLLPESIAHLAAVFMPAVSFVMFQSAMGELDARGIPALEFHEPIYDREPHSTEIRLLGGLALFNLAMGVARGFPFGDSVALSVPMQALHQLGTTALCLGVVWWVIARGRKPSFTVMWSMLIGLLATGVLMLATLAPALMEMGSTLVTISNTFALGVMWYLSYDYSRHSSRSCYLVLGAIWAVHLLAREVGRVAILLLGPYDGSPMLVATVMAGALALSLLLLVSRTVPSTRPLFADLRAQREDLTEEPAVAAETLAAPEPPAGRELVQTDAAPSPTDVLRIDALDARLLLAHRRYQLTAREVEIARLLAQGRSKADMAEKLMLSESTIRTHARNLYAKLDVHNRSQLLDLLEALDSEQRSSSHG